MNEEEKKIDLRELFAAVKRRRRPMLVTALTGVLVTLMLVLFLPAHYRSGSTILIEQQELPSELVRSTVTSYADQRVQTISQRVMTTQNLLKIIDRYDLYRKERDRDTREELIAKMRRDIRLDMISADVIDPRSGLPRSATIAFSVSYTSRSPEQAMRVANELTTLFLNENITERTRLAQDAADFLTEEGNRLSTHIQALEAKLAEFKEKNGDSMPDLSALNMTLLDRTTQELRQQEARLMSLDQQRVYLDAQLAQIRPFSVMMSESGERILTPADRLKSLRSQLASLRARYAEDHPDIVRTEREIAGLEEQQGIAAGSAASDVARRLEEARARLATAREKYAPEHPDRIRGEREVEALEAALANESARPAAAPAVSEPDNPAYVQLQAQLAATRADQEATSLQITRLKGQLADYERKLALSPQVEREYRELARDYQNSQAKYQELRSKQMEAQVAQNMEAGRKGERFTLIEPPLPPEEPVSPNRVLVWAAGVLLSVGFAIGIVALLESLDSTIRSRQDLIQLLSEAPLALVPTIGTAAEALARRQRRRLALGAVAVAALSAIVAVHFVYRPVDVLWFSVLRKIGM